MPKYDPWRDPDVLRWMRRTREKLPQMIEQSAVVMSLVPEDGMKTDVKFAVELGFAIMLDKPIIAVVQPGSKVSEHMIRVADEIVECNMETEEDREKLAQALDEAMNRIQNPGNLDE